MDSALRAVAADKDGNVWAVGTQGTSLIKTLIMHYVGGMTFSDVHLSDYFHQAVSYLYCAGVVSGYADNHFRPYSNTTRAQLTKVIVLAEAWTIYNPPAPTFLDVPADHPFYTFIETAHHYDVISGYSDRTFRPENNVTRGQTSKVIVRAEGWPIDTSGGPHFTDVATDSTFYPYVETAFNRHIISGYSDNTFRPNGNATRGQVSKIVYNAITTP